MNAQMLKLTVPAPRFLVICLVSIAAVVTFAAGPANPDRRALKQLLLGGATRTPLVFAQSRRVHGPFVPDPRRFTIAAPSSTEGDELVESTIRQGCTTASCAELLPADGDLDALSPALTSGPWTPGRIDGIDPQIAASDAYLTVATNNTIGFYDKAGALLRRRPNRVVGNQILVDPELENPVSARDFFKVFWADPSTSINQWLNLPDGLCDPANPYPADKNFCLDAYYDVRAVYDEYRQRFWVGALVKNTANKAFVGEDHLRATSRRDAFVFAVSRTQDPRDGWFFYWIAAVGDAWRCRYPDNPETAPDRCGGYWPGDGSDYEHIGVSERFFVMSVPVKNGSNPDIGFMGTAEDPDPADRRYTALFVLDAHALANGQAAPHWVFGIRRENSDGHNIQSPIAPAIHHGSSPFELTWLSSTFGSDHLTVFALLPYQPLLLNFDLPVRPFSSPRTAPQPSDPAIPTPRRINLGTNVDFAVQKTVFRNGRVHAVWHDCRGGEDCLTAIRLVRVCATCGYQVEIDRRFGTRNILEPADWVTGYGWPSLEVNNVNDTVLSYQRAGENVFYEARYSVYPSGAPDILPSNVLRAGEYPLAQASDTPGMEGTGGKLDITGSAVDPFDDNAVWMIQKYAYRRAEGDGASKLVVGKVFGQRYADLYVSDLSIARLADGRLQVSGEIGNGGDALAEDATLAVRLVARSPSAAFSGKGLLLDELSLGRIPPGASMSFSQLVVLPQGAPSRLNIVEATGATRDRQVEYTYDNNTVGLPLQTTP